MRGGRRLKPGEAPARRTGGPDASRRRGRRSAATSSSASSALGSALGSQARSRVARKCDHVAVGKLAARRVEISAEHSRRSPGARQPEPDPLQRPNLDPPVRSVRNVDARRVISWSATTSGSRWASAAACSARRELRRATFQLTMRIWRAYVPPSGRQTHGSAGRRRRSPSADRSRRIVGVLLAIGAAAWTVREVLRDAGPDAPWG
jgi:hypothetical protein